LHVYIIIRDFVDNYRLCLYRIYYKVGEIKMKNKSKNLLESLRKLTPNFKLSEEGMDMSVRDIIEPQDMHGEDDSDKPDTNDSEEGDFNADDLDGEEGEDLDDDGDDDDINALDTLKDMYDASDEDTQKIIGTVAQMIVDNDIDLDTLQQFIETIDVEDEEEISDEDVWGEDDLENHEESEEDEEEDEEENADLEPEDEDMREAYRNFNKTRGSLNEEFGLSDDEIFSSGRPDDLDI
jgi:hypothetical protein